ncbi:MAG: PAS domain-containing sensor histidine kinase [Archaeoglobaceae archaeon]
MNVYNLNQNREELFEILLQKSLVGNFIIQDERLVYFNEAVEKVTGYTFEELKNLNPFEIVHPEDRSVVYQKYVSRINRIKEDETYSFRIITKDGAVRWITARALGINYKGKPGVAVNAMDTTHLIELTEELRKKNELLSHLSSILRHDILGDVAIISAAIELRDENMLQTAFERIKKIREKIEDIKKLEEEMGELKIVNAVEMARYAVEKYSREANIVFRYENVFVMANESLKSAIENIVNNAIVHNPEGVKIEIDVFRDGKDCVVRVSDNGVGIDCEIKKKLFSERISTRKGGGLGLLIVKKIVETFRGSIRVYDNKPQGTVFEIRIPCVWF